MTRIAAIVFKEERRLTKIILKYTKKLHNAKWKEDKEKWEIKL